MVDELQDLLDTIRESTTPALWSKGVELARQDAVTGEPIRDGEARLTVKPGAGQPNQRVTLFLYDSDWQCSCGGKDDPCAHVAAAVIALKRARERGDETPLRATAAGKVIYQWRRTPGGLALDRVVRDSSGQTTPLTVALTALIAGRIAGPDVSADEQDLTIELALSDAKAGVVPQRGVKNLLRALIGVEGMTIDGQPLRIDLTPVGARLVIEDEGPGVRTRGEQDPAIKEVFTNGLALCGDVLRPLAIPDLTPVERPLVQPGRFFGRQEFPYLVGELLPGLTAKMALDLRTRQLPQMIRAKPEAELELKAAGDSLHVKGAIAYADQHGTVVARVTLSRFWTYGAAVPERDLNAEAACRRQLEMFLPASDTDALELRGGEAVRFVARLGHFPGHVVGDGAAAFSVVGTLTPSLTIDAHTAHVGFAASKGQANAQAVCAAWQAGDDVVRLEAGGFAKLPADWLARYGELLADILAARAASQDGVVPKAKLLAWASASEAAHDRTYVDQGLTSLLKHLADDRSAIGAKLAVTPRPYQERGIEWLVSRRDAGLGAILADDMGLGKTLQTIAAMPEGGRILVVAPTSVLPNWAAEMKRFRPTMPVRVHHGAQRQTNMLATGSGVIITSYALLRLDIDALAGITWDYIVFDEAQALKNADSQVAGCAALLKAKSRVALTGTPIENRLEDLWSEMHSVNPGLFGTLPDFRERYAKRISQGDQATTQRLRAMLKPFLLRRLKRDVAPDLPARTESVLRLALSDSERKLYDALMLATRRDAIEKIGSGDVLGALEALLRLRQACCHPRLIPGQFAEGSSKLDTLVDRLEELTADGHKALVFSQWTSFLDLMEPALRGASLPYLRLDGSTTDRAGVVDRFQAPDGPPVLIMSLKAGGVGLNLTAADHVFIMDPWWNPAAEDQAADRAHRIGQTRPVLVHRLVAHDTVEEKILVLQDKKRAFADVATGTGAAGLSLTRDDIMQLLE